MRIDKREWESVQNKIAALEQRCREQQKILDLVITNRDEELKQMKCAFEEIKENLQNGILKEILKTGVNQNRSEQIDHQDP